MFQACGEKHAPLCRPKENLLLPGRYPNLFVKHTSSSREEEKAVDFPWGFCSTSLRKSLLAGTSSQQWRSRASYLREKYCCAALSSIRFSTDYLPSSSAELHWDVHHRGTVHSWTSLKRQRSSDISKAHQLLLWVGWDLESHSSNADAGGWVLCREVSCS